MHLHPFRPRLLDALYGCGRQRALVLRLDHVLWIGASGADALAQLHRRLQRDGLTLCLCKAEPGGLRAGQRTGFAPT